MPREGSDNLRKDIEEYLDQNYVDISKLKMQKDEIIKIANIIKDSNQIFICGNGGSAATASHFANDLQKMCCLKAISLTDNVPLITAISNDCCYQDIFEKQILNWYLPFSPQMNYTLVVITGSGDSDNIDKAILTALRCSSNITFNVIAFVGMTGGKVLEKYKDEINIIHIDTDMLHSEDWHLILCHLIAYLIKEEK